MAGFASKGVAGAGLGTGIAGLALGVLNSSNNGNGLLGGLFGGGNQNVVSALQAENSMLKAENYSDKNAKEVYAQSLADNRRLRDETFAYLKSVNVICGVDNEGNGVMACLVPDATGKIKSNALKFRTINMDGSSATKTRSFKVYITVTAEISNTNFSLGQLFSTTK